MKQQLKTQCSREATRVKREEIAYNRGFDEERRRYDSKFGHTNSGYEAEFNKSEIITLLRHAKGKRVLELGSTAWNDCLDINNYPPSQLVCINISQRELEKGVQLCKSQFVENTDKIEFMLMDAHKLEFEDESFDIVFGGGILHHLDFETAIKETFRVLKTGGFCVFTEPLSGNPIGKIVRKLTPYARTPDEKPLGKKEIHILEQYFKTQYRFRQLLYVPAGVISSKVFRTPYNPLMKFAFNIDMLLERYLPFTIKLWYRHIVICATK